MKMKLADFVAEYLVSKNITHNFVVPGGGSMYLNSSLGHQDGMNNIYVQHEQAAAIAAEAYYRISNVLPVVSCTTGPGGTNTLTGVLGAWLDSIPMLVISGQVKYCTTVRSTGYPMRIMGDQEFDITKTVANMTKYSEMVTQPQMIKYHLDKALYLATHGRPGPVWLDIPNDIQNATIDTDSLYVFDENEMRSYNSNQPLDQLFELILKKIELSKRPVIYSGVEIRTAGAYQPFLELIDKLNIPVVTSFDGIDILEEDHPLYVGRAGDVGNRYGNWAVQNSDLVISLGSRLGIRQVGYAYETWARDAFVVMVYPDPLELTKTNVHVELPIRHDIKDFISKFNVYINHSLEKKEDWFEICKNWREHYPVVTERHRQKGEYINPYWFVQQLSRKTPCNMNIVSANGSACNLSANVFELKKNQRLILNSGCASMGYDLPASIGAAFADSKKEILCLAGDGSIQMNLQELETIVYHKLPIKIVLINNGGYHSMRLTQANLFKDLNPVGIGPETNDLGFPNMEKIAEAYGIPYYSLSTETEFDVKVTDFFETRGYAMLEVFVDQEQVFEPKPTAKRLENGQLTSPPLEDLAPFLPREELERVMIIPLLSEE